MAEVHPLYNYEDVKSIRRILTKWENVREAECFFIGCHVGLRASDLLNLKFEDFHGNRIVLSEIKTKKKRDFPISSTVLESVNVLKKFYLQQGIDPVYLFQSTGNRVGKNIKPISQSYYYRKITDAISTLGIEGNFGTHTPRKTFGHHLYKKTNDIALIQKLLNHASSSETLNYIGVTRKTMDDAYMTLDFSQ